MWLVTYTNWKIYHRRCPKIHCVTVTIFLMVSIIELHTLNWALVSSGVVSVAYTVLCWALFCILSQLSNMFSSSAANSCYGCSEASSVTIEGPLRRKTLLKEGRKPRVRWSLISLFFPQLWLTVSANTSPDDGEWDIFGISIYSACCVTVVIMDQILDHSVWINTDILWGESTEGLWEETCKFDS